MFRVPHMHMREQKLADTPSEYKDPEEVIQELLDLNLEDRLRFEKCCSALSYCGLDPDELENELVLRTLDGRRRCPAQVETAAYAIPSCKKYC